MIKEFIFEEAPFAAAHASTIAETSDGLVAAWFAGTREGQGDVGIWVARRESRGWLDPVEVADGRMKSRRRYPCWNPVLFQPRQGPLLLFYKVGPSPSRWWGVLITSEDGGRSWSEPRRLPAGILGPIKNKPLQLPDGRLLCPSSDEQRRWRIHLEWTDETATSWRRGSRLNDGRRFAAIQPCLLPHADGRLQMLCRTRQGAVGECWSEDGGESWTPLAGTELPNPDSGIDAVTSPRARRCWSTITATRRGRRSTSRSATTGCTGRRSPCWRTNRANSPTRRSSRGGTARCT